MTRDTRAMNVPRVLTVSASYGTGGSVIAPRLATALGIEFADRILTTDVTDSPAGPSESEQEGRVWHRFLDRVAVLTGGMTLAPVTTEQIRQPLREAVETSVGKIAASGGVILGRAAMFVLADTPGAYHVRLDGPAERRIQRGMAIEHIDAETARRHLDETDRARSRYTDRLYGRRADDPSAYHLVLDSTVLGLDDAVDVIRHAAEAFWAKHAGAEASI